MKDLYEDFKSIVWPSKKRIKKEFSIILITSILLSTYLIFMNFISLFIVKLLA